MPGKKKGPGNKDLQEYQSFFSELEQTYHVSHEDILEAIKVVGMVKSRLRTYFVVQEHLKKKARSDQ